MYRISQNGNVWQVFDAAGHQLGADHATYDDALAAISDLISAQLAAGEGGSMGEGNGTGMLPERWHSTTGVAFSEPTGDGRDFSECTWTTRDPNVYALPLMDQTETDVGHFGAELAGFCDTAEVRDGTVYLSGGFYDSGCGLALRDRMLVGRVGVSVDPGLTDVEFVCTSYDEDGWCDDGTMTFLAYQVIGLTSTPFPGFERATIELDTGAAPAAPADGAPAEQPVAASFAGMVLRPAVTASGAPIAPPAVWFHEPEPQLGDPRLVEQEDGSLACPLTITDDGQVYGHLARWGQCHIGNPMGPNVCTEPPESSDGYPGFHLGHVVCDDGTDVPTGVLVAGCDHPSVRLSAPQARDHYAHQSAAWADVRCVNGDLGPWISGALRPDVDELRLRVLRASSLSGDWRPIDGRNELITGLAVNVPGFPISRRALVASGMSTTRAELRAHIVNGEVQGLVASGIVQPCPECARRAAITASAGNEPTLADVLAQLESLAAGVNALDLRTRHLRGDAAGAIARRIARPSS